MEDRSRMRVIPLIIGAIVLLCIPLVWLLVTTLMPPSDGGDGSAVDSGARIEIEGLREQIEGLRQQIAGLEADIESLNVGNGLARDDLPIDPEAQAPVLNTGPNAILDAYADLVLIADRRNVNEGIEVATPSFLEGFLGRPREVLTDACEPMTNAKLAALLITEQVGPIKVTMLRPALDSLKRVFENVQKADPDLYARINTSGSLCVRRIRGTVDRTSTHSFGLAVDLNIDGHLDGFADGKTQLGLTILADFFQEEGWVWGAGYGREDSMHFEVSRQQLEAWRAEGKI